MVPHWLQSGRLTLPHSGDRQVARSQPPTNSTSTMVDRESLEPDPDSNAP